MAGKILGRCIVAAALALIGYGVIACGDDGGSDGPDCSASTLTYANFGRPLITSKCIACHSAIPADNDIRLDTLENIKTHSEHVIEHAVELEDPAMPYLMDALPQAQREDLRTWLECGAPP